MNMPAAYDSNSNKNTGPVPTGPAPNNMPPGPQDGMGGYFNQNKPPLPGGGPPAPVPPGGQGPNNGGPPFRPPPPYNMGRFGGPQGPPPGSHMNPNNGGFMRQPPMPGMGAPPQGQGQGPAPGVPGGQPAPGGNAPPPYMLLHAAAMQQQQQQQKGGTPGPSGPGGPPMPYGKFPPPHGGPPPHFPHQHRNQKRGLNEPPLPVSKIKRKAVNSATKKATSNKPKKDKFPAKLMQAVMEQQAINDDAVAWLPDGKSFVVVNPELFVQTVMGNDKVFPGRKDTKYPSFVRKLHRWGFVRLASGTGTDCFYHPLFKKDRLDLIPLISCTPHHQVKMKSAIIAAGLENEKPPSLNGVEKFINTTAAAAAAQALPPLPIPPVPKKEDPTEEPKKMDDEEIDKQPSSSEKKDEESPENEVASTKEEDEEKDESDSIAKKEEDDAREGDNEVAAV